MKALFLATVIALAGCASSSPTRSTANFREPWVTPDTKNIQRIRFETIEPYTVEDDDEDS